MTLVPAFEAVLFQLQNRKWSVAIGGRDNVERKSWEKATSLCWENTFRTRGKLIMKNSH